MSDFPDNAPGGEDHEDYRRGDLSGVIYDVSDGMASVRFLEHGAMRVNLVVRADGSLGIDPSGIPKPRRPRLPAPAPEGSTLGRTLGTGRETEERAALPPADDEGWEEL